MNNYFLSIMGNLFCQNCDEYCANKESMISLSDHCVERMVEEKEIVRKYENIEDDVWMQDLRTIDDIHSNEHGLTMQSVEALMNRIESLIGTETKQYRICYNEQLIQCLQKHENCIIKCKIFIDEFIDCVDKFRIEVTKREVMKERKKLEDEDENGTAAAKSILKGCPEE